MASVIQRWNRAVSCLAEKSSWFCHVPPHMFVQGRVVPMPILNETFDALKAISSDAPFGKGSETVVDKTVRDAKQIVNTEITFDNSWNEDVLSKIVEEVGRAFNTKGLRAELYKMLLYERGGHFKPHRDTLRSVNHVASLLISLPVEGGCEGGELKVKGPGLESETVMSWDGRCRGLQCSWAAFFTDCEHELLPLTAGRRVTLAYNLFAEAIVPELPTAVKTIEEVDRPREALIAMSSVIDDVLAIREYVLIALDHFYGVHVQGCFLKGRDRQVYETLYRLYGERLELKQVEAHPTCDSFDDGDHWLDYGMYFVGEEKEGFFQSERGCSAWERWRHPALPPPHTDCIRKNEPDIFSNDPPQEQSVTPNSNINGISALEDAEAIRDYDGCDLDELFGERQAHFVSEKYAFFFDSKRMLRVSHHFHGGIAAETCGNDVAPEEHRYRFSVLRIRRAVISEETVEKYLE